MTGPALRVIVDGDSERVFRKGDAVCGRVVLLVEEEEQLDSLKIIFGGNCVTKTTRPFHVNGGEESPGRNEHEEKIRLFNREKELAPKSTLAPKKYSWPFEFIFPDLTEPRYKRITYGANYLREPHPLPPSFQLKTNVPGGAAQISYFVQARLTFGKCKTVKRCRHLLSYSPSSPPGSQREARCTSTVLYGQQWKPSRDAKQGSSVNKVLNKVRRASINSPRITPSLAYPESIAPGQHIPISISLRNAKDALNETQGECTLDSMSITMSTYSTSMCGHSLTQPEDVVSKHVTCIARININKPLKFNHTKNLTTNFRLIDDAECIPSFKTYTITRRYTLGITIGLKFGSEHFKVRSSTPLEILPRIPRDRFATRYEASEECDPLPLYQPREPSKEFAPDYEEIFALCKTPSSANSLASNLSRISSYTSDGSLGPASVVFTAPSTPGSEIDEPVFQRIMVPAT